MLRSSKVRSTTRGVIRLWQFQILSNLVDLFLTVLSLYFAQQGIYIALCVCYWICGWVYICCVCINVWVCKFIGVDE